MDGVSAKRKWRPATFHSIIATLPMAATAIGVFVICIIYSVILSFTNSRLFPNFDKFVGWDNYERLWSTTSWIVSVENLWIFGFVGIIINMSLGFLIAAFMDRQVRMEDTLRTIILYPYAMSLIVTGLVWQWMLDPGLGFQETIRNIGFEEFTFSPLTNPSTAIYGVVIAGVWQGSGVTMAIILAGLRGIDVEIWKAARVDGIPVWRTYLFIVLPMCKGALATALVLQCVGVVRVYDLIVAMTDGGPGIATEMPAKFVIDHISSRINVALGMSAATMLLMPILVIIALGLFSQWRSKRLKERAVQ